MRYPTLTEIPTSRDMVDVFGGYNHNLRIGSGEFYDMQNLTAEHYPILSPRGARGVYATPTNCTGMISKDSLCYVDGKYFVMNEYQVDMELNDEPKTLVSMGAYVIILPDKKYINTANIEDRGDIESAVEITGDIGFDLCTVTGDQYAVTYRGNTAPQDPKNMEYWIDTSATPNVLKQYSQVSGMWVSIATTYIKISATGIGTYFEKFDGVEISGLSGVENKDIKKIDGSFVIWDKGADFIVVIGMLDDTATITIPEDKPVSIKRTMPNMDFIIESENRLWGCRYGLNDDNKVVNEIYASKLGDFKNWNCFMGISTDSYVASVGTDGQFTGAVTHMGHPLFFKENFLHKVYGNYPANYQVQTTACRGVQKGSFKSPAIVNEILYYKSRLGVCAYDGSLPVEISTQLGEVAYFNAIGGAHGNKYYISMVDSSNQPHLFVYDTAKGLWHKEDDTQADIFCSCKNEMYYLDRADGKIKTIFGSGTKDTTSVKWMAESGILGTDMPDRKYISRLNVRMSLEVGSTVQFFIEYDSSGAFLPVGSMTGKSLQSFTVPIRPRRCDHMRLRIVGEGPAKVFSICKTIEQGSDL